MSRNKISTTVYLTPRQDAGLKTLSERTKVPVAAFIRMSIDALLEAKGLGGDFMERAEDTGRFDLASMLDAAPAVPTTGTVRDRVLAHLATARAPLTPTQIADAIDSKGPSVSNALHYLSREGRVKGHGGAWALEKLP